MPREPRAPETPALIHIRPAPDLAERFGATVYIRGLPPDGRTMTRQEAQPLLDAGLVIELPASQEG